VAVGSSFDDSSGTVPLAEAWNGSSWSIQRTPNPFDAFQLNSVSCASSTACIAVGNGQQSFAERWDGKRWSPTRVHFGDPQNRANALAGVSCTSNDTCAAVGWDDVGLCGDDYSDYSVPVLGFWTSARWSLRRHPNLGCSNTYGGSNGLYAVSCASAVACTAVGTAIGRWDGAQWSIQRAPIAAGELLGVSCASKNACTAVGSHRGYSWNGHAWSPVAIPWPAHVLGAALNGVSCTSRESCVAVGRYTDRSGEDHMLVESVGVGRDGDGDGDGDDPARHAKAASER